jgi:hypothetical protein
MVCDQDIKDALLLHKGDVLAAAKYLEVQAGPKIKKREELQQYVAEVESKKASFLSEFKNLYPKAFKTDQQNIKDGPYIKLKEIFEKKLTIREIENIKDYVVGLENIFDRKQDMLRENFDPENTEELMRRTREFSNVLQQQSRDDDKDDRYAFKAARVAVKEEPGVKNTGDSEMTGNE